MDLSPIANQFIGQFLVVLAWILPVIAVISIFKSPWFKGMAGEFMVNLSAGLMLDKKNYRLIKNVTLPTEDGTTQIDQVIVSVFGVFVIETKNMKGWIFGQANQSTWTQKIYRYTNKFQNPLRQNYKHVKILQSLLGLADEQIHPLVVFTGDSKFKTEMPENVTSWGRHIRFIKSKTERVLSEAEVDQIVEKIQAGKLEPFSRTQREHVQNVKKAVKKQKEVVCPRCGSSMVLRTAKNGPNKGKQFWGCSKFPKCKGIINIDKLGDNLAN